MSLCGHDCIYVHMSFGLEHETRVSVYVLGVYSLPSGENFSLFIMFFE